MPKHQTTTTKRRKAPLTTRERDLLELRALRERFERQLADALITVLRRADSNTLAALGVIVVFVAEQATRPLRL